MANLPSGAVTFLFTDIVDSTEAWESSMQETALAIEAHDQIVEDAIGRHDGFVFARGGDSFCAAFARPSSAIRSAIEAQRTLTNRSPLQVRMSIHTGEAVERAKNYYGPPLNRVARILEASRGGQVLVSGATRRLLPPGDFEFRDLGERQLRNVQVPLHVLQLVADGINSGPVAFELEETRLHGLPVQRDLFGRESTLDSICTDLRNYGVVTLMGPGGVGRRRLQRRRVADGRKLGTALAGSSI